MKDFVRTWKWCILSFAFLIFSIWYAIDLIQSMRYENREYFKEQEAQISQLHLEMNQRFDELFATFISTQRNYLLKVDGTLMTTWSGTQSLNYGDLYVTIETVLDKFPREINNRAGLISLLIETISTESFFGQAIVQRNGPALGIFQMEPNTYSCIQDNYLKYNDDIRKFILLFKDRSLSNTDNLKINVQYQIAYAITHYYRYNINNESLVSHLTRADVYKRIWNTSKGSGSIAKYCADIRFVSNFY